MRILSKDSVKAQKRDLPKAEMMAEVKAACFLVMLWDSLLGS